METGACCPRCLNPMRGDHASCPLCGAEPGEDGWPADPHVGRILEDRYRIDQRVSADGMTVTFRATKVEGGGQVVVKMLNPDRAADPEIWNSFVEQVQAAQDVDSPAFASIQYVGMDMEHGDVPYIVHETVKGETLADLMARDLAFDIPEALAIAKEVARGMRKAHERKIFHRHIRPEKVVVLGVREPVPIKILDLGFAAVTPQDEVTTPDLVDVLRYMPPGQEEDIDARTDIYALGVMLFEMIAGRPPSGGKGISTTSGDLVRLKDLAPGAPEDLDRLVHDMMARDPARRPGDMERVIVEILKIEEELSTETHDGPAGGTAGKAKAVPRRAEIGRPSPVVKAPELPVIGPRRVIGGERFSAEIFSRPTKPPARGRDGMPAAAAAARPERKPIHVATEPRKEPSREPRREPAREPRKEGRKLSDILAEKQGKTRAEADRASRAVPPPPVVLEEVLPALGRKPEPEPEPEEVRVEAVSVEEFFAMEPVHPEHDSAPAAQPPLPPPAARPAPPLAGAPEGPGVVVAEPAAKQRTRLPLLAIGGLGAILLIAVIVLASWLAGSGGTSEDESPQDRGEKNTAGRDASSAADSQGEPGTAAFAADASDARAAVEEPAGPPGPPQETPGAELPDTGEKKAGKDGEKDEKKGEKGTKKDDEKTKDKKWELLFTNPKPK